MDDGMIRAEAVWPECELYIDALLAEDQEKRDERFLAHLKEIEAVVLRLLETEETLFDVRMRKKGICLAGTGSLTGKKFVDVIRQGCDDRCRFLPFVNDNPYVQAHHAAVEDLSLEDIDDYGPYEQVEKLNAAVTMIRGVLQSKAMREYLTKLDKAKQKRRQSAQTIINALRDKHARVEVLRLDLNYRKGKYVDLDDFAGALSDVKRDWARFRHDLVNGLYKPGVLGYMAKLEYGLLSGFHFHVVVICNGSKHWHDIQRAQMLGEHWKHHVVTPGEGRYYNCNRHKDDYRYLGIGTLDYYDHAKYSALVNLVVEYMIKTDFIMAAEAPGERVWFRSAHKPLKVAERRGRPRKFIHHDV
ncbi:MAG: inovirus-type Gp2 protein [Pseudomonadota bacterium]|nr:inovirus-type Gp2 protein [Pseudomonadota bacterium]